MLYFHLYKYFGRILNTFSMYLLQFPLLHASCYRQNHVSTEDRRNLILAPVNRLFGVRQRGCCGVYNLSGVRQTGTVPNKAVVAGRTKGLALVCSLYWGSCWRDTLLVSTTELPTAVSFTKPVKYFWASMCLTSAYRDGVSHILLSPLSLQNGLEQEPGQH